MPQTLHIGSLALRYYGLFMAGAIIAGYWLAAWRAPHYGFTVEQLDRLVIVLVVSGFVGARIYHVASDWTFYSSQPIQAFMVWRGGLGIFGALAGGVVGLFLARQVWLRGTSIFKLLDWLAPSLLLGQIIGRFGNLFNYEIFGYPTGLPWKMFVPPQFRPFEYIASRYFHPLFLYEALFNAVVFFILLRFVKDKYRSGSLFFGYLFLYNAGRFFLELLRPDSVFIGSLRLNSLVSAALMLTGLAGFFYFNYAHIFPSNTQRHH